MASSMTINGALIAAALADGIVLIEDAPRAEPIEYMIEILPKIEQPVLADARHRPRTQGKRGQKKDRWT